MNWIRVINIIHELYYIILRERYSATDFLLMCGSANAKLFLALDVNQPSRIPICP